VTPRKGALAFLFLILFSGVGRANSENLLRVALLQNASSVTVISQGGIRIFGSDGKPLWKRALRSVTVEGGTSLRINGRKYPIQGLLLRPAGSFPLQIRKIPFRGVLRIKWRSFKGHKSLLLVNEVELETYLRGVVPVEISAKWHPEVLKTQAVISRTYALYQKQSNSGKDYDLVSSVQDQVYAGKNAEDSRTDAALNATRGEVLTYEGNLVFAAYHSTSAGPTEDAAERWSMDLPYLKGVSCPLDQDSPYYRWERKIDLEEVEAGLNRSGFRIGTLATLTPFSYSKAGRVLWVRILHSGGELILRADDLRKAVGTTLLPSTSFDLVGFGKQLVFRGMGYGHGVGLCQWGAKVLAEQGAGYREILKYYYPGVSIQPLSSLESP
jgi:stage II sporulation protein D